MPPTIDCLVLKYYSDFSYIQGNHNFFLNVNPNLNHFGWIKSIGFMSCASHDPIFYLGAKMFTSIWW